MPGAVKNRREHRNKTSHLLRREQSFRAKCLDSDGPVTEVWSLTGF